MNILQNHCLRLIIDGKIKTKGQYYKSLAEATEVTESAVRLWVSLGEIPSKHLIKVALSEHGAPPLSILNPDMFPSDLNKSLIRIL